MASRSNLVVIAALFIVFTATAVTQADSVSTGFQITYGLQPGQRFLVAGNTTALGNWNLTAAAKMNWTEGNVWTTVVDLTAGEVIEFKLVEVVYDTNACICWDADGNKQWKVPTTPSTYYFTSFTCDPNSCNSLEDITIKEVTST